MTQVSLDGAVDDPELARNLLVRFAVGHQAQRGQLAGGELHVRDSLGKLGGSRGGETGLSGKHIANARDEIVGGDVFQDVGFRSRLERSGNLVVRVVGGEHDD
jgi:hypothetical protein